MPPRASRRGKVSPGALVGPERPPERAYRLPSAGATPRAPRGGSLPGASPGSGCGDLVARGAGLPAPICLVCARATYKLFCFVLPSTLRLQFPELRGLARPTLAVLVILGSSCATSELPAPGWRQAQPHVLVESSGSGQILAGASRLSVDPPFAGPLGGYVGASWFDARMQRDPLHVRAIVLEQGAMRLALVALDRVLVPPGLRPLVEQKLRFREARLTGWILAGTHSHTAPGGYMDAWPAEAFGMGAFDPLLLEHLAEQVAEVIHRAASSLEPVVLEGGSTQVSSAAAAWISFNRRDPEGSADSWLDVLRFRATATATPGGAGGPRVVARLLSFAAHPTLIPFYLRRASGDYPGILCRTLEARDAAATLFAPGPCADLAAGARGDSAAAGWEPRMERIGRRLAKEAVRLEGALERRPPCVQALAQVALEIQLPPRLPWNVPLVGRAIASHYPETALLQCVRVGDILLVTFPGEMSHALGEQLRAAITRRTGARQVVVWTLADQYLGYAFTREELVHGGKSQHLVAYGPDLGPLIETRLGDLAEQCWRLAGGEPAAVEPRREGSDLQGDEAQKTR